MVGESERRRRLDQVVTELGLTETRARAQAVIMGGGITVDGVVVSRPAAPVPNGATVELVSRPMPYVSRGGLKLEHALDIFEVRPTGTTAADVGASTGGFTDLLLQRGASKVYAIDVGYGQLAWTLRNDERVVVLERTNVRSLHDLPELVDLIVIDVSFISLRLVLPVVRHWLIADGAAVVLIKPQFEAGREHVGKGGVVRDPAVWRTVLHGVLDFADSSGWTVRGLTRSPLLGPAGNVEFLAYLTVGTRENAPVITALVDGVLTSQ